MCGFVVHKIDFCSSDIALMACCTRTTNGHTNNDRWVPLNVSNSCVYREGKQKPAGHTAVLLLSLHFWSPSSTKHIPLVSLILLGISQGGKMRGHAFKIIKKNQITACYHHLDISILLLPNVHQWLRGNMRSDHQSHVLASASCGTQLPRGELRDAGRGRERTWCVTKMKTHFPLAGKISSL